jgi:hypothetical protein
VRPRARRIELQLRIDAVEWEEVEDRVVAMDLRTSAFVTVNRTGARLWPALVEGTSVERLATALREAFGIERAQARRDAEAFVQGLRDRDLLAVDRVGARRRG